MRSKKASCSKSNIILILKTNANSDLLDSFRNSSYRRPVTRSPSSTGTRTGRSWPRPPRTPPPTGSSSRTGASSSSGRSTARRRWTAGCTSAWPATWRAPPSAGTPRWRSHVSRETLPSSSSTSWELICQLWEASSLDQREPNYFSTPVLYPVSVGRAWSSQISQSCTQLHCPGNY